MNQKGVTLIELVATMAILSILMSGVIPLSQVTYKRSKEIELKQNLRVIRNALDTYKEMVDQEVIPKQALSSGYPATLDILVDGVVAKNSGTRKIKFLRRIPKDPMTKEGKWGLRSYDDNRDSKIWGGQDVYDVYSKSDKKALDGTSYRDW